MAEKPEEKVVRIVNLGDTFTVPTLKDFVTQMVVLEGDIENLYIKKHPKLGLVYAYIIFEKGCDASKVVTSLNSFTYETNTFDAALIAPELPYKKYADVNKQPKPEETKISLPGWRDKRDAFGLNKPKIAFSRPLSYKRPSANSLFDKWRGRDTINHNKRDRSAEEIDRESKKLTANH